MRKNKLNFSSEQKKKRKQTKAFIIAFAAFVVVLGTVSMLMFMNSVNFNLNNLVDNTTKPSEETTTVPTTESEIVGDRAHILLICNGNNGTLACVSSLFCNMQEMKIEVLNIPISTKCSYGTLNDAFVKSGTAGLCKVVEEASKVKFDRYIKVSESELCKLLNRIDDIHVQVPEPFSYQGEDFKLNLDAGTQSLTPDMYFKYLTASSDAQKANIIVAMLNTLFTTSNIPQQEKLFNFIVNHATTDISVVDYTKYASTISASIRQKDGSLAMPITSVPEQEQGDKN